MKLVIFLLLFSTVATTGLGMTGNLPCTHPWATNSSPLTTLNTTIMNDQRCPTCHTHIATRWLASQTFFIEYTQDSAANALAMLQKKFRDGTITTDALLDEVAFAWTLEPKQPFTYDFGAQLLLLIINSAYRYVNPTIISMISTLIPPDIARCKTNHIRLLLAVIDLHLQEKILLNEDTIVTLTQALSTTTRSLKKSLHMFDWEEIDGEEDC